MEVSSIIVLSLIGVTVLVLSFRNVRYNKARDRAYNAYRQAVEALRTEFSDNLDLVSRMHNEVALGEEVSEKQFKTNLWLSLDKTFLNQMDDEDANDLGQIYNLIGQAEKYNALLIGVSSQFRKEYRTSLLRTLEELAIKLRKTLASVQ